MDDLVDDTRDLQLVTTDLSIRIVILKYIRRTIELLLLMPVNLHELFLHQLTWTWSQMWLQAKAFLDELLQFF